jgi:3-oxoacyl-[acyl-carrier protein] reductase
MIGKKILITGASRGIGLAVAKKLSPHYKLILHARTEESFGTLIPNSELLCADLSNPAAVNAFCARLKKEHGDELYAVINNAGISLDSALLFQPESAIDKVIQVNLKAPIMICKAALKVFTRNKAGVIINLSSVVGETGNAFQAVYSATKAGLVAFSKSLAREVGALNETHSIRILSISPGFIATAMTDRIPAAERAQYLGRIAAKQFGTPADVANLVAFLLSDQATYINGTNLQINGGLL